MTVFQLGSKGTEVTQIQTRLQALDLAALTKIPLTHADWESRASYLGCALPDRTYPKIVDAVFQDHAAEFRAVLRELQDEQMTWARSIQVGSVTGSRACARTSTLLGVLAWSISLVTSSAIRQMWP